MREGGPHSGPRASRQELTPIRCRAQGTPSSDAPAALWPGRSHLTSRGHEAVGTSMPNGCGAQQTGQFQAEQLPVLARAPQQ